MYMIYTPPTPTLDITSNSGSTSDTITNDNTPTIIGTVPAGEFVQLYVDGVANGSQQLGSGVTQFSITTSTLTSTTHSFTIRVAPSSTTPTGNYSYLSSALSVTIDTAAPSASSVPDLLAADDSGISSTDNITKVTTPRFSGTAETGATVTLLDNTTPIGTGTATGGGTWQITASTLSPGTHTIKAQSHRRCGQCIVRFQRRFRSPWTQLGRA